MLGQDPVIKNHFGRSRKHDLGRQGLPDYFTLASQCKQTDVSQAFH